MFFRLVASIELRRLAIDENKTNDMTKRYTLDFLIRLFFFFLVEF